MDRSGRNRVLSAADTVVEAATHADYLVAAEMKSTGMGARDAAAAIATRHKVPPNLVRGLLQPSRRPKTVDHGWWMRLWWGYLDRLRQERAEIELRIARAEALGVDRDTVRALQDEMAALARRIEALADKD